MFMIKLSPLICMVSSLDDTLIIVQKFACSEVMTVYIYVHKSVIYIDDTIVRVVECGLFNFLMLFTFVMLLVYSRNK